MRLPQATRSAEDGGSISGGIYGVGPRRRARASGNPLVGLLGVLLSLVGVVVLVLRLKEGSFADAGAVIDGWLELARAAFG